jgi:hypothetical protein
MARTTCALLIACLLGGYTPSLAEGSDTAGPSPTTTTVHSDGPIRLSLPATFDATSQSQFPQRPIIHRCCNLRGMIIGAAIGAGAGWWLTHGLCDAGDCTLDYIKVMATFGGIGAVVGGFADRHNTIPIAPPDRRFRVGGIVTPRTREAFASFAF